MLTDEKIPNLEIEEEENETTLDSIPELNETQEETEVPEIPVEEVMSDDDLQKLFNEISNSNKDFLNEMEIKYSTLLEDSTTPTIFQLEKLNTQISYVIAFLFLFCIIVLLKQIYSFFSQFI